MEIILTNETFNEDNIFIKYSKTNQKIIYNIDQISILGIPLKLKNYTILYEQGKNVTIELNDTSELLLLKNINDFFFSKYKNNYKEFIKDNTLKLRKNDLRLIKNNENIYISINNIKKKGNFFTINSFII